MRSAPAVPPGPIVTLVYHVPRRRRAKLLRFLRRAIPLYEKPGGIRVGLYESVDEPGLFLELVSYATARDYARDQRRVERDPAMLATLKAWRRIVGGPIDVGRMKRVRI